jgi:hypothetical protein
MVIVFDKIISIRRGVLKQTRTGAEPLYGSALAHPKKHKGIDKPVSTWRRALSYAWWHAEIGADLAADAGLSERAVLYIRTHHEPHGPAAALHRVDEVS